MKSDFIVKNMRRKQAKVKSSVDYRQGRLNRKSLAWQGAFGVEVARVFNDCVLGTSTPPRQVKNSKEDLDAGADYD